MRQILARDLISSDTSHLSDHDD